ncbi:MAG: LamG domain-containing protein, partial [Planctomycetota bacterium]
MGRLLSATLALFCAVFPATVRAGLVSHWRFDGNLDDSVRARSAWEEVEDRPTFGDGVIGPEGRQALVLDGEDDAYLTDGFAYRPEGGYSVSFWIRGRPQPNRVIYLESGARGPAFLIGTDETGERLRVQIQPPPGSPIEGMDRTRREAVLDGAWHHVVWVDGGRTGQLYVDRFDDRENFRHSNIDHPIAGRILGAGLAGGARTPCCHFEGEIDDLRVYDHELTGREVLELFAEVCTLPDRFAFGPIVLPEEGGELRFSVSPTTLLSEGYWITIGGERYDEFERDERGNYLVQLGPMKAGTYRVALYCHTGSLLTLASRSLTVAAPDPCVKGAATIDRVEPPLALRAEFVPLTIHGSGFTEEHRNIKIGTRFLQDVTVVSSNVIVGRYNKPPLGVYDVEIQCDNEAVVASLPKAVEFARRIEIRGVSPRKISVDGGSEIGVSGLNFRPQTEVLVDGQLVRNPRIVSGPADVDVLVGNAPAGVAPGFVDIEVRDSRGSQTLEDAVEYVLPSEEPGPAQIEASYAEGTMRIAWQHPGGESFRRVNVLDSQGRVVASAPRGRNILEIQRSIVSSELLYVVGETEPGVFTRPEAVFVGPKNCDTPPRLSAIGQNLNGRFDGLVYEDAEFSLYGSHEPADIERCIDPDPQVAFLATPPTRAGAMPAGVGASRPRALNGFGNSEVTTGFVLDQDATKLEIALHYRKLQVAFGVELRCRIAKVGPDRGFVDEFTFPDTVISDTNRWNVMTYFRADSDVGREFDGKKDPGPQPCPSNKDCSPLVIPAGEYTVTFYAVGGAPAVAYYSVSMNPSPEELLIPDTPCPPYPLARVRDVTKEDSLPVVNNVIAIPTPVLTSVWCPLGLLTRRITALGFTLDECNNSTPLSANDPRFEYRFTVYDSGVPQTSNWVSRNWIERCLDCGCYRLDVEVRATGCPVTRVYRREIVVLPDTVPCTPARRFDFLYPQPNPRSIVGVVGLTANPPFGDRVQADKRPLDFSVLVSPNCDCDNPNNCAAARLEQIEFDLGVFRIGRFTPLNAGLEVLDSLCPNEDDGPKYFQVSLADLGRVRRSQFLDSHEPTEVFLIGRAKNAGESWQAVGYPMKLYNPPDVLGSSSGRANFSEPNCYF